MQAGGKGLGGEVFKLFISRAFESLLGPTSVMALRFHVERRLGRDMYEVFYEDPGRFYKVLRELLGSGAEMLMRLVARWLNENGYMEGLDPDKFIELLEKGGEEAAERMRRAIKPPYRRVINT
jgi:hypothetical protein